MPIEPHPSTDRPDAVLRFADLLMLIALGLASLATLAVGIVQDATSSAVLLAGVPAAAGALVFFLARGTLLSRGVLLFGVCACVAAQIHLGYGRLEYHFGVFVAMALLLVYRDWRMVVAGAGVFAVHHVLFDRLQAAGFGVYCTAQPDFARIVLHAVYLIIQTVLEVFIAVGLAQLTRQSEELEALGRTVVADGKVSLDMTGQTVTSTGGLALKDAIGRIEQAMSKVRHSVDGVQRVGSEITDGNSDLSARTDQAALHLQQTATLLAELTGAVLQSAAATREADALAATAAQVAERGGSVVAQVVATMNEINTSSQRIAEIIGVIDGIAFQTNILSLNAAVEAARAGEQGRGFAVVATEVRSLARRSADAAKEIKGLIGTSVDRAASGARLVGEAGHTMADIVASVHSVSTIIGRVAATSAGQTRGIDQANASIAELDGMTRQNAALVEQSAASAASLRTQAETMAGVVAAFRLQPA